jgi:tRNA pseudouridine38-40 synthase
VTEPAVPLTGDGGLVRLRLDLGYDGTAFAGWAVQPGQRTVQAEVEAALATVLRLPSVRVTCAGRTDAGVHARGQVVHVDVPSEAYEAQGDDHALHALGRRLAGVLPIDIGVRAVRRAPDGFDARFSPLWRRYAYRVSDDAFGPDPLRRHDVLSHRRTLDVEAMNQAARGLEGEHDFAAYCRQRAGATTLRTLLELRWVREDDLVVATVMADAFCHSMVRALVGASLAVGEGRRDAGWPAQVLAGRQRVPDVLVAPAHGLTLEEVRYPDDDELADRAAATRRRREPPRSTT